jgi:transposase InsO family protein
VKIRLTEGGGNEQTEPEAVLCGVQGEGRSGGAEGGSDAVGNTDQGSQFTSAEFVGVLESAGVRISMDGRGRWMDNVMVERLWRSLEYENVYLCGGVGDKVWCSCKKKLSFGKKKGGDESGQVPSVRQCVGGRGEAVFFLRARPSWR